MSNEQQIIVVDDQSGIRLMLEDMLTSEGFRVSTAQDGKEALQAILSGEYKLIIIDYKLPLLDGVEVIKKIREKDVEIPAILMSGLIENIKEVGGDTLNGVTLLPKPFDIRELREIVAQLLG